ncbi:MAG: formimidoylglutamate deiminase [Candidatus Dormiibacterota bacterium]|jgi:formiminoglutamate deiminase
MSLWLAERAWTGSGVESRLLLEEEGGTLRRTEALGTAPVPAGATVLPGLTLPGLANVHSHSFHRALRGRCELPEEGGSDFWGWRRRMYALASFLTPDQYFELTRAAMGEMAMAGITAVGEFHYLHHRPSGQPYPGPEMEDAVVAAAAEAGLRLTLLDTCYLRSGFEDAELGAAARRFTDHDAQGWARRADRAREGPRLHRGAAIHSVRAVDVASMKVVAAWAADRGAPLHLHLSEQPEENSACLAVTGQTPTELLDSCGVLGARTTAVHAIHLMPDDVARLGRTGTKVCVCPTTERDLGDGVCRADELLAAGSPLCLGSDSNAVVDLFEEARAVELDRRLVTGRRGWLRPEELMQAATRGGMAALGWSAGELRPGQLADFTTLDPASARLAGAGPADILPRLVFGASAADVVSVVVGGEEIVRDGRHLRLGSVAEKLENVLVELEPAWRQALASHVA